MEALYQVFITLVIVAISMAIIFRIRPLRRFIFGRGPSRFMDAAHDVKEAA